MSQHERLKEERGRKGKGATSSKAAIEAPFVGYLNVDLTDKEKEGFIDFVEGDNFGEWLEYFCVLGWRVSVKYRQSEATHLASAMCTAVDHKLAGYVITARSAASLKAFHRVVYILWLLHQTNRQIPLPGASEEDAW